MPNSDTPGDIVGVDDLASYFQDEPQGLIPLDPNFKPRPYKPIPMEWLGGRCEVPSAPDIPPELPARDSAEALADPVAWRNAEARWDRYHILNGWRTEVLKHMQPGDELWTYSSGRESFRHLAGRSGYAILRDGKIVASLRTTMN